MYSNADIDSLSVGQLRKLLKGGAVRVRCGSGMKVGLSAPQHKKLMSAHNKGKMMTLTMDPYQMEMHGQGLFGDIVNFVRSVPKSVSAPVEQFVTRQLPSALIHEGLPRAGETLGGIAGGYYGGPAGSMVGSELGSQVGRELARETGRRTGYGVKKGRGTPIEDQRFSLSDVARTGKRMFGGKMRGGQAIEDQQFSLSDVARTGKRLFGGKMRGGQAIEDQQFSLSDIARTGKRMFGGKMRGGQAIEDQQFSLSDVARTGKRLFGGKVKKGKGFLGDMLKVLKPVAKKVATKLAREAGSYAIHKALPMASERLGEMGGDYLEIKGGKDAGRMMGQMLEKELADRTGLGLGGTKGSVKKRGRPRKMGGALMVAGVR
jgi:hypothetical protein